MSLITTKNESYKNIKNLYNNKGISVIQQKTFSLSNQNELIKLEYPYFVTHNEKYGSNSDYRWLPTLQKEKPDIYAS